MQYDDLSCPFLRLKDDTSTSAMYPTLEHVCNHTRPFSRPSIGYQRTFCLKAFHTTCPVFTGQRVAMPAGFRGPGLRTSSPRLTPALTLWLILPFFTLVIFGIWGYKIISASHSGIGLPSHITATPSPTFSVSPTGPFSTSQSDLLHGIGRTLTGTPNQTPTRTRTTTSTPKVAISRTPTSTSRPHGPTPTFIPTYNPILADQTITFNPLSNKTYGDPGFTVSASASSSLVVSFGTSGNCSHSGSTISITGAGSCTVTASQGGNASYNPAVDVSQSFTISKANGCNISDWSGSYDGNAHGAAGSCPGTGVLDKGASYNNVPGGSANWSYTGDANYNSQSGSVMIAISMANPTFSFDNPGDQIYRDNPFDITVSATASSGVSVSFGTSGNCSNNGNIITITGTGSCTVTASVGGTSNYNPGSAGVTFHITGQ